MDTTYRIPAGTIVTVTTDNGGRRTAPLDEAADRRWVGYGAHTFCLGGSEIPGHRVTSITVEEAA